MLKCISVSRRNFENYTEFIRIQWRLSFMDVCRVETSVRIWGVRAHLRDWYFESESFTYLRSQHTLETKLHLAVCYFSFYSGEGKKRKATCSYQSELKVTSPYLPWMEQTNRTHASLLTCSVWQSSVENKRFEGTACLHLQVWQWRW
jgi:hypothetical protein